jgi:hypothetical protein
MGWIQLVPLQDPMMNEVLNLRDPENVGYFLASQATMSICTVFTVCKLLWAVTGCVGTVCKVVAAYCFTCMWSFVFFQRGNKGTRSLLLCFKSCTGEPQWCYTIQYMDGILDFSELVTVLLFQHMSGKAKWDFRQVCMMNPRNIGMARSSARVLSWKCVI